MTQALALAPVNSNTQEIDIFRLGDVFAKSGYFTDAKDASQAIVKILAGREIGIGAMASMTGFHIVQGKPTLSANLIASIIKNKQSGYNYKVLQLSESICEIEFFEQGQSIGKSSFTIDEAKTAQLTSKDVWKKHPKNMLFARAISNGAKWYCPDVFNGATVYTPEELDAEVNGDGEVINLKPVQQVSAKPQLSQTAKTERSPVSFTEQETKWRGEIISLSERIGKREDGLKTAAYFDANPDMREKCLRKVRITLIKTAIASEKWGLSEDGTTEFLNNNGVVAIDEATDAALDRTCQNILELEF